MTGASFAVLCVFALRILHRLEIRNAKTQRTAKLAKKPFWVAGTCLPILLSDAAKFLDFLGEHLSDL